MTEGCARQSWKLYQNNQGRYFNEVLQTPQLGARENKAHQYWKQCQNHLLEAPITVRNQSSMEEKLVQLQRQVVNSSRMCARVSAKSVGMLSGDRRAAKSQISQAIVDGSTGTTVSMDVRCNITDRETCRTLGLLYLGLLEPFNCHITKRL